MEERMLQEIGLTNSEIKIYITLLKTESIKVGNLIKKLNLHRSRVYESINRLIEKGLVSYIIKSNVKYFRATDPEKLLTHIEEQKEKLTEKESKIKKIIPELRKQKPQLTSKSEAHVFEGKEGFKTIRKDVLKQKKDLYLIGAIGKEDENLEYFFPNFNKLRIKSKIKWKILYDAEARGKKITKEKLMETRFIPKEYSSPAVINVYGDRVVNVLWDGDVPMCFMIINKDIADSYRKWFGLLWKFAEK